MLRRRVGLLVVVNGIGVMLLYLFTVLGSRPGGMTCLRGLCIRMGLMHRLRLLFWCLTVVLTSSVCVQVAPVVVSRAMSRILFCVLGARSLWQVLSARRQLWVMLLNDPLELLQWMLRLLVYRSYNLAWAMR